MSASGQSLRTRSAPKLASVRSWSDSDHVGCVAANDAMYQKRKSPASFDQRVGSYLKGQRDLEVECLSSP